MASKGGGNKEPQRGEPTVGPQRGIELLEERVNLAAQLLADPNFTKESHENWQMGTRQVLVMAFGEGDRHINEVINAGGVGQMLRRGESRARADEIRRRERVEKLTTQVGRLRGVLGVLRLRALTESPPAASHAATTSHKEGTLVQPFNGIEWFVSHSARNEDLAAKLCGLFRTAFRLSATQIRCTTVAAYALRAGANISSTLRAEIQGCRVFVAILTDASNESAYVQAEIGARWMVGGYAVILRGGGFEPSRVRGPLSDTHSLDLGNEDNLFKLIRELGQQLGIQPESPEAYTQELKAVAQASKAIPQAAAQALPSQPIVFEPPAGGGSSADNEWNDFVLGGRAWDELPELSEIQRSVLHALALLEDEGKSLSTHWDIARTLEVSATTVRYYLDLLGPLGLVECPNGTAYSLSTLGRAYIVEHPILEDEAD